MSERQDLQLGLIDVGLFWGFYHAAVGKNPPELGTVARDRFESFARNCALKYRRAILADDSEVLSRRDLYPGYKPDGERRHPEEGKALLMGAVQALEAFGLPVVRVTGFEADDVLAELAYRAAALGWMVRIHSEDKDLLVCMSPRIRVYRRDRGKGGAKDWAEDDVIAQFKVPPHRLTELLAVAGDSVDGIPGVAGIGKDGAAALLQAYEPVTEAFKDIDPAGLPAAKCPERIRKALAAGKDSLALSYQLASLRSVPIDMSLLEIPKSEPPPAASKETNFADVITTDEPQRDGTVIQTIQVVKEEPRSALDEIVQATDQRAVAERWIGREFSNSLEPRNIRDAWWLAERLHAAMVPGRKKTDPHQRLFAKIGNKEAIYAVILKGRELNLPAMLALSHIHMVEGKAEVSAALMVAMVLRSGLAKYVRCTGSDNMGAAWETWRIGHPASVSLEFTDEDRRRAGLGIGDNVSQSPWIKYPRIMYEWRSVSQLLKREYPDIVAGMYVTGELSEAGLDDVEVAIRGETVKP